MAETVRLAWHYRVDHALNQSTQEWGDVLDTLRGWDNQALVLTAALPPDPPTRPVVPEDVTWTTSEPPSGGSSWGLTPG